MFFKVNALHSQIVLLVFLINLCLNLYYLCKLSVYVGDLNKKKRTFRNGFEKSYSRIAFIIQEWHTEPGQREVSTVTFGRGEVRCEIHFEKWRRLGPESSRSRTHRSRWWPTATATCRGAALPVRRGRGGRRENGSLFSSGFFFRTLKNNHHQLLAAGELQAAAESVNDPHARSHAHHRDIRTSAGDIFRARTRAAKSRDEGWEGEARWS